MEATRFSALFRTAVSNASPLSRLRFFSSSPATNRRTWQFYSDDPDGEESAVYKHALKFQRPSTVQIKPRIQNSVSFIGTIDFPLKRFNTAGGSLGVHTWLTVSTTSVSKPSFKIKLKMWDAMAELSLVHLKWNDLIYVWGHLTSYVKAGQEGNPMVFHEVIVKEINFVARHDKASTCQESKKIESDEDRLEKSNSRLHLWQVFFSNPYEWRDNRENKVNPKGPDFKHMYSGEALWLRENDPPWIRRQLELMDSRSVGKDTGNSQVSPLIYD